MTEEAVIACTEMIKTGMTITVGSKAVLGAFAVAGKKVTALAALSRQRGTLARTKLPLAVAVHHLGYGLLPDVAELIRWVNKIVATEKVAIKLHCRRLTTQLGQRTDARRYAAPVGQRGIKELNKGLAHIIPHPLIKYFANKPPPLFR